MFIIKAIKSLLYWFAELTISFLTIFAIGYVGYKLWEIILFSNLLVLKIIIFLGLAMLTITFLRAFIRVIK